jgi:hypothetical protein
MISATSDGKFLDMIDLALPTTGRLAVDAARTFPGRHATVEVWDGGRMVDRGDEACR